MRRKDWLLAFLAIEPTDAPGAFASSALDPIRIMKGIFLFQNEDASGAMVPLDDPSYESYEFEPYAYGPFTAAIYHDLEDLEARGLVKRIPLPGRSYANWQLTEEGLEQGRILLHQEVSPDLRNRLRAAKKIVLVKGFSSLLRYVYDRYPDYARESVVSL